MKLLIKGAKSISKESQASINGGKYHCGNGCVCPVGWYCVGVYCERLLPGI